MATRKGMVKNKNGVWIYYNQAVELMDDDIRENLSEEIAPCTNQEFFTQYEERHALVYGEEWELSKANPIY